MAQMQKPTNASYVEQRAPQGNHQPTAPVQTQAAQQQVYSPAVGQNHAGGEGSMVPYDSPEKLKLQQESRSGPNSPTTPDGQLVRKPHNISPGERGSNLKAEAFADAHSKRVEAEAKAYIDAEARKAEANAEKQKVLTTCASACCVMVLFLRYCSLVWT
jgi:ribosomal protein L11